MVEIAIANPDMLMLPSHEDRLVSEAWNFALPRLSQTSRRTFLIPHTLNAIHYAGLIGYASGLDTTVIKLAAALHDIGYPEPVDASRQAILDLKPLHMKEGGMLAQNFLDRPHIRPFLTDEQSSLVRHLVEVHDVPEFWDGEYERVLMEVDTLAQLATRSTLNGKQRRDYILNDVLRSRRKFMRTPLAKELLLDLVLQYLYDLHSPDSSPAE